MSGRRACGARAAMSQTLRKTCMSTFQVGDRVHWLSRGGASFCLKEGLIEQVIPAGEAISREQAKETDAWGQPRSHESYLVRVGQSDKRKGKLYWPQTKDLRMGPAVRHLIAATDEADAPTPKRGIRP